MSSRFNLSGLGAFELVYSSQLEGDIRYWQRRPKQPAIAPVDIPFLSESRVFLCGASNLNRTWYRAGTLFAEVGGLVFEDSVIFPGLGSSSSTADFARQPILLNNIDLVVFPRLTDQIRLRFEPMPWIDRLTLAIWEYKGTESDTTEDKLDALRAQVTTLDFKVDQLRS